MTNIVHPSEEGVARLPLSTHLLDAAVGQSWLVFPFYAVVTWRAFNIELFARREADNFQAYLVLGMAVYLFIWLGILLAASLCPLRARWPIAAMLAAIALLLRYSNIGF
jgi:hypothetical protein